jgi:predicted nuclease of predicted toxin-antitoxin system
LDSAILEKARDEGRVVLAHDLEFGDLLAASGDDLPSVVIFRLRNMRPERVSNALDRVLAQCRGALEKGAVVSVDEVSIRTRPLPIKAAQ